MPDYYGFPTRSLENRFLRLEYLAQGGPRLVRLFSAGSDENLFAEIPEGKVESPFGIYRFLGGHRLWHAPEAIPRTYIPDHEQRIEETRLPAGVRLAGGVEPGTGIRKQMEIHLAPDRAALTLVHQLTNEGLWAVELAPWALTQLRLGGTAVFPQTSSPLDAEGLLPNRQLVLWPYTSWSDPRLVLNDDYLFIIANPQLPPVKIGYFNRQGWFGYLQGGIFLVKRFQPQPGLPHADFDCNVESYCNHQMIELETLGPMVRLAPGAACTLSETWELYSATGAVPGPEGIRFLIHKLDLSA